MDIIQAGTDAVAAAWSEGSTSSPVGPQETVEIALRAAFAEMGLTIEALQRVDDFLRQDYRSDPEQELMVRWVIAVASVETE